MPGKESRLFAGARALALLTTVAVAACSTIPSERASAPPLPAQWEEAAAGPEVRDITSWWRTFNDPVLDRLVAEGLADGPSVRRAALRVQQARAQSRQTLTQYLPNLTANARGSISESIEGPQLPAASGGFETRQGTGSYGAQSSWEIPLFQRAEAAAVGANANTRSARADLRGAHVSLAADIAQAYIDLRAAQNRRAALAETVDVLNRLADILETGARAGLTSEADAADARRLAESTRARLPDTELAIRRAETTLAVLRGKAPGTEPEDLRSTLGTPQAPPTPAITAAPGAPADLLRLRSDVVAAEEQALFQAASVGVARAELLPRLTLTGSITAADSIIGAPLAERAVQGQLIPLVSMPLLDWGQRFAAVRERKALFQTALVTYQETVARAVAEASLSLAGLDQGTRRLEAARAAEAAATINARGVRASYDAGIASLTDRLRADQQLIDARLSRIEAETTQASAAVSVYRAFGGGPPDEALDSSLRRARDDMR